MWALAAMLFALGVGVAVVALTEDAGRDEAVVPTVVGLARTTAESRIRAAGLVARLERRPGTRLDVVVRQQPEPGAVLLRGSTVTIGVRDGAR